MQVFIQITHGVIGAAAISAICIWQAGSYGEARHTISIIGAIAIIIASLYILRSRWVRWGKRQVWLKYHQRLASLGLCLVLLHSAFQPLAWHSWVTLILALSNLGTGIAVSLAKRKVRQTLLKAHLILAPILLISIVFHGQAKLDHDDFFPLTDVHDVPCAKCHTSDAFLFNEESTTLQQELDNTKTISDDILRWWRLEHEINISPTAIVKNEESNIAWKIVDNQNRRNYHIKKQDDKLAFYADSAYRSYTCITCHEHNTPELISAHVLHGVNDFHRCLVCHQTEIDGTKYGRQRVNWDYDPNW